MPSQLLTIQSIIQETSDTKSFLLREVGEKITYQPGQFLTLLHPRSADVRRSYSLCSHPQLDQSLKITVKRIANGEYSRWLFDVAKTGNQIQTIGASGFFTLPDDLSDDTTLLFLAAGSGITPILALLKEVLFFRKQRVVFIYSNRTKEDAIFCKELLELERQFPARLKTEFLFSNHQNLLRARLSKALLAQFIQTHLSDKSKSLVYLCGPNDYMQMAIITLTTEGILTENIHTEIFNTEKPKTKNLPPDTDPHEVNLHYQGKLYSLTVKYPNTILQTAKLAGIDLPYSCEAGRCGTCA
ncbi:MAG TPA: FAD-binding oxidoreductase, partial [Cyclobacteriaceae bacterium]